MGTASVLIEMLTIKIHMMFIRIPVRACSWKDRKEVEKETERGGIGTENSKL